MARSNIKNGLELSKFYIFRRKGTAVKKIKNLATIIGPVLNVRIHWGGLRSRKSLFFKIGGNP